MKNIYILGGNGLIGKEIVKLYSKDKVKIFVLDIKKISFSKKKNIKFVKFDCSKLQNSQYKIKSIFEQNGKPDIFINCSYPSTKNWSKSTINNFKYKILKENFEIHLNNYVWTAKIIANEMKRYKSGSIILLGSIYGYVAQDPLIYEDTGIRENYNYSIIKSGIIGSTRQLASFFGKYNIRINCVCPGGIEGHIKGSKQKQSKKFKKKYLNKILLNRLCKPEEAANVCKFFASDMASYVTGQTIFVDGGYTAI